MHTFCSATLFRSCTHQRQQLCYIDQMFSPRVTLLLSSKFYTFRWPPCCVTAVLRMIPTSNKGFVFSWLYTRDGVYSPRVFLWCICTLWNKIVLCCSFEWELSLSVYHIKELITLADICHTSEPNTSFTTRFWANVWSASIPSQNRSHF